MDEDLTPEKARRVLGKLEGLFARIAAGDEDALRELFGDAVKDPEERARIEERRAALDLAAEFEAEGRPYAVLDDGNVEVRGGGED